MPAPLWWIVGFLFISLVVFPLAWGAMRAARKRVHGRGEPNLMPAVFRRGDGVPVAVLLPAADERGDEWDSRCRLAAEELSLERGRVEWRYAGLEELAAAEAAILRRDGLTGREMVRVGVSGVYLGRGGGANEEEDARRGIRRIAAR